MFPSFDTSAAPVPLTVGVPASPGAAVGAAVFHSAAAAAQPTTVAELATEIRRYERFIKVAGGGVTISGGEPCNNPP